MEQGKTPPSLWKPNFKKSFQPVGKALWRTLCRFIYTRTYKTSLALLAWLATALVMYRIGLKWVGYLKPCSCLGNLTDALNISPQTADMTMKINLAYLLVGSYANLLWISARQR